MSTLNITNMNFIIVSDTAGSRLGELCSELRKILVNAINLEYKDFNVNIGFAIRCLPKSYNRKSFVRYTSINNDLTIDFCVLVEDYIKNYKIEQRFDLGNNFLLWLDKGLDNKRFVQNNPNFDREGFKKFILEIGRSRGWFLEEVDYSQELEM